MHRPEERIVPVAYGRRHEELADFLRRMARSTPTVAVSSAELRGAADRQAAQALEDR